MNTFENYKVMGDFLGTHVINLTKGKGENGPEKHELNWKSTF